MKTISYDRSNDHSTTDLGVFAVKSRPGYNRFEYFVTKVSGEWPTKDELGSWLNYYYDHFGGTVQIGEDTAYALIHGAD
jgi:hypothetical protein